MGNTLEDILALAVAGMASYVAVLNLPLKRSDIKAKVAQRANNFVEGVTAAMAEVGEEGSLNQAQQRSLRAVSGGAQQKRCH